MRALLWSFAALLPASSAVAAMACPDRLAREPAAPFERLGLGGGRGTGSALEEAWLVYGAPGEEMKPAPATSAPDESRGTARRFTNRWRLDARDPMLLVCIYGSGQWLRAMLPPDATSCTQTGEGARVAMRCE